MEDACLLASCETKDVVDALKRAQERIRRYSETDPVTELPNRTGLQRRLAALLTAASCEDQRIGLIVLDLDDFRCINSALGHQLGDSLLREVGHRIRGKVAAGAVARLGDDEFAIVVADLQGATQLAEAVRKIARVLVRPFIIDGHEVSIKASMGVAVYPEHAANIDDLVDKAELAVCEAKRFGRQSLCFYEEALSTRMQAWHRTADDLRKALIKGEFELHYQPIVRLADYHMSGAEALVRWRHPDRGMIPPAQFIPVAEESGFIVPLGEWIIAQACADAVHWPEHLKVAVNLSAGQFKQPNLAKFVGQALGAAKLPGTRLALEITESTLLADSEASLNTLHQLRKLGVGIVMDDFGTGYSSLDYLRRFPFEKIKIDRSFISNMTSNKESLAIVRTIVTLADNLGMTTVGEGVERSEQLAALRFEGCNEIQGYFISPPRPAREFKRLHAAAAAAGNTLSKVRCARGAERHEVRR